MIADFGMRIADCKSRTDREVRSDFADRANVTSKKSSKRSCFHFSIDLKSALRNLQSAIVAGAMLIALCFSADAQQPKKVFRIGYLSPGNAASDAARFETIRQALRELGYIEGQNITMEYRYSEGKSDRYPELAAELVRLKVDIILVAGGTIPVRATMNATKTIPIVMAGRLDPVGAGVVESLARPGGNVTGLTNLVIELSGKRLELLKEAIPKVARVAVLYDPLTPGGVREVKEVLPVAARALGLTLQPWEVRGTNDFERVFAAMGK
jgi:putative ABC transport system substrate-binding protein